MTLIAPPADRPTGYERCFYLVDFDGTRLWLPEASYKGYDEDTEKDVWEVFHEP